MYSSHFAPMSPDFAPGTSRQKLVTCHGLTGGDGLTVDILRDQSSCQRASGLSSVRLSVKILGDLARRIDG